VGAAKDIVIEVIPRRSADAIVKLLHYSHGVVRGSTVSFGVFYMGRLEGALQFGSPMDKRKVITLVRGTAWHGFLELNRMALSDRLPRNSESRALSVCFRLLRKHAPQVEWILSFADGTRCGDGTIYRAAGFVLTGIRKNKTILRLPDGRIVTDLALNVGGARSGQTAGWWKRRGAKAVAGFQLRYIYFLNPAARVRLAVPVIPFAEIERAGAAMYLGKTRGKQAMVGDQPIQRRGSDDRPAPRAERETGDERDEPDGAERGDHVRRAAILDRGAAQGLPGGRDQGQTEGTARSRVRVDARTKAAGAAGKRGLR
jgi:hypothetical protein